MCSLSVIMTGLHLAGGLLGGAQLRSGSSSLSTSLLVTVPKNDSDSSSVLFFLWAGGWGGGIHSCICFPFRSAAEKNGEFIVPLSQERLGSLRQSVKIHRDQLDNNFLVSCLARKQSARTILRCPLLCSPVDARTARAALHAVLHGRLVPKPSLICMWLRHLQCRKPACKSVASKRHGAITSSASRPCQLAFDRVRIQCM